MKYTNELINETSPYLREHAHNPVNWHAWNDQIFEKAKKENNYHAEVSFETAGPEPGGYL